MDINLQISGDILDYIDIEDLRNSIRDDISNQIRYAVQNMVRSDNEIKSMIYRTLVEKVSNAALPADLAKTVHQKFVDVVDEATDSTVQYSWGLYERAKEILEDNKERIEETLTGKINAAVANYEVPDYQITSVLTDIIREGILARKAELRIDDIVDTFISEKLVDFIDEKSEG